MVSWANHFEGCQECAREFLRMKVACGRAALRARKVMWDNWDLEKEDWLQGTSR